MAQDYVLPSSAELALIAQDKLPRLTAQRPIFDIFPIRESDNFIIMWEQKDNFLGLQAVRGLNGDPPKVNLIGAKRYQMQPGVYGEYKLLDEIELTTRRQWGSFAQAIDLSDMVMDAQDHLLGRRLDRIESILWTLCTSGTFSIPGPNGAVLHTDTFNLQTFAPSTTWSTFATATPLADLRTIKLLHRGHSVSFGPDAKLYLNQKTLNNLLSNTNNADLYGRRTAGLGTFNSIQQINELFMADNLPTVVEYDEGYLSEGAVTALAVASGGTGYTVSSSAGVLSAVGGGGSGFAGTATTNASGNVISATITNGGSGYYQPPTIVLTGLGAGTGASFTPTVTNAFNPFIPDNTAILVGRRPNNEPVGNFVYTRNANNPGMAPGAYMKVIDRGETEVPRRIEIHDGYNGGPTLSYGTAIVKITGL